MGDESETNTFPYWNYELGHRPRHLRSPSSDATETLCQLDDLWVQEEGKKPGFILDELFPLVLALHIEPEDLVKDLVRMAEKVLTPTCDSFPESTPFFEMSKVVASFCDFAIKTDANGDRDMAWTYAADALVWLEKLILYAEDCKRVDDPEAEQGATTANYDFSAIGKIGAERRHAPMRDLRAWAVAQYDAKSNASANKAAHDLKEKVIAHGRTIGAELQEQNAQRTIAEWLRKSKKKSG